MITIVHGLEPWKGTCLSTTKVTNSDKPFYHLGWDEPNYPVPTLLGRVWTDNICYGPAFICIDHPDPNWDRNPIITWWNENLGHPMPEDHGVADYIGN